jgi:hypothetical protein
MGQHMERILKYQVGSPLNHWHLLQYQNRIALLGSILCQHRGNQKMQDCNCLKDQEEQTRVHNIIYARTCHLVPVKEKM